MNPARTLRAAAWFLAVATLTGVAVAQAPATRPETVPAQAPATQPDVAAEAKHDATRKIQDISYSVGYDVASKLTRLGVELDADQLALGIKAGLGQSESRLTPGEIARCLFDFQRRMQRQHFTRAQDNLDKGLAYLKQNAE